MGKQTWIAAIPAFLAMALLVGCEALDAAREDDPDPDTEVQASTAPTGAPAASGTEQPAAPESTTATSNPEPVAPAADAPAAVTGGTALSVPADFSGVVWLYPNVSGWAQTATLDASVSGDTVYLRYNKAEVWPPYPGDDLNANAWVFVFQNGVWYAATWEWLRFGQTTKSTVAVKGDHIKKDPLTGWAPRSGEVIGFMVSGLCRDSRRTVEERSNVDMVVWP